MQDNGSRNIEAFLFSFFDDVKNLLGSERWSSILMDYSKNELLTLFFIYRVKTSNMSEIAEYINAPLNTATGVVARLEKKSIVHRQRQDDDRRVVNISLTEYGMAEMQSAVGQIMQCVNDLFNSFSEDEIQLVFRLADKAIKAFKAKSKTEEQESAPKKIRRITIE